MIKNSLFLLNFLQLFDTNLLLFNLFNLSQCKLKEKQPPAKMTTQIVKAHLSVDNHRDLLLNLGRDVRIMDGQGRILDCCSNS